VSKETYYIGKRDLLVSSASRVGGQHILCKGKERRATNERKQRNILCGKKTTHTHTQTHTHTHREESTYSVEKKQGKKAEKHPVEMHACLQSHALKMVIFRIYENWTFQNL